MPDYFAFLIPCEMIGLDNRRLKKFTTALSLKIAGASSPPINLWANFSPPRKIKKSLNPLFRVFTQGMRTSRDLELAASKRAVPLLLAMADSPVGDGDTVFIGLVLDVLCRVARLRVSGARYNVHDTLRLSCEWCLGAMGMALARL